MRLAEFILGQLRGSFGILPKPTSLFLLLATITNPAVSAERTPLTGLWAGTAQIVAVSQFGSDVPKTTGGIFELPLIIHVDETGRARLLKEVVLLSGGRPGGESVRLLSNPAAKRREMMDLPEQVLRKSRRIATAAYDFAGQTFEMSGAFQPGGEISGTIIVETNLPTNPFAHRYHPDHDNLIDRDPAGREYANGEEIYRITREIRVSIPAGSFAADGAGESLASEYFARIIGTYEETVDGLAAKPVVARGRLFLTRIAMTAQIEE